MIEALRSLLSFNQRKGESIRTDQGGFIGGLTLPIILAGFFGIFGISFLAAINWAYLLATLVVVVIGLTVTGSVFFNIPFKYVIIVAVLCLGIVVFLQVGALAATGIILVGGVLYKFSPAKRPAIFIGLIGLGSLLVIWGSRFAVETLGVMP